MADNNTHIDGCIVGARISFYNYGGGIVGTNRDSKISNCGVIPVSIEVDGNYNGGIAGQNLSVNAESIIENCYAVSLFGASYSSFYPAGIVGNNLTEGETHKAIVRNCYAAPLSLYGEYCGGIAGYNSGNSLIENSYTNNSSDYGICGDNHGEIVNCSIFNGELQLSEDVEVSGEKTDELVEALNLWVSGFPEGLYLPWIVVSDETNYGFPVFGDLVDIDEMTDSNVAVYPNPADDFITIKCDGIIKVDVYDVIGKKIKGISINCFANDL